jgi:L-ascorbate metabolism protein UlaG (beta-lactamase superfamily)
MGISLTHIGGPTVLLDIDGWRILTDPTFDPPGRRYAFGWGTASTKDRGPALTVDDVLPVDAVLLTHDHHADNLDERGRALLADVPRVVTTGAGAARIGDGAVGLAPWAMTRLDRPGRPTLAIRATPCRHGPPLSRPIVGDVVGFALTVEGRGRGAIWFTGDTVWFPGLREVARRIDVDVAVLHLGGVRFPITGPLRYTMTARQGMRLCRLVEPRVAVPVHYEGWSHFRDGPEAIERELMRQPSELAARFRLPAAGVSVDLDADAVPAGGAVR